MAATASAYAYAGYKWPNGHAYYSIDSSIPSAWHNSIYGGSNAWNVANPDFSFYSSSSSANKVSYGSLGISSTLARTTVTHSGSTITKCVIVFNSDYGALWSTSGQALHYDVQSVAAHEFGHWLSLDHSSDTEATMYYRTGLGETKKRTVNSDDIRGTLSIY